MIEIIYKNRAEWTFVLWSDNPFIEVFRPVDVKGIKLNEAIPFEVIDIGNNTRSQSYLKKIGNEWPEYSRKL